MRASNSRLAFLALSLFAASMLAPGSAAAWGDRGHEVTALIAYRHLTPKARERLDALLASDDDTLTPADFASRTTWADKYRSAHRETAAWHFINIEIDGVAIDGVGIEPTIAAACFGLPHLAAGQPASSGPAQDCIVNKIDEFFEELKSPATQPAERLLALKFLIHFIGDLHQPLHAADHDDRGGNCIALSPPPTPQENNLHAYWDVGAVAALGDSAREIASALDSQISVEDMQAWTRGNSRTWTLESYVLAKQDAYALATPPATLPTCRATGAITLSPDYRARARQDAALQLKKAGIRLAGLLNDALSAN
jgi:nuclease S1